MSVLRKGLVEIKSATGSFIAHTMDLEKDFKLEAEALKIFLNETEKLVVCLSDTVHIINDRLEVIERKQDGAI